MNVNLEKWLIATHPWSIPVSAVPVILVCFWLYSIQVEVQWSMVFQVITGAILFQLAGNFINDYFDHPHGIDTIKLIQSKRHDQEPFLMGCFRPQIFTIKWYIVE